MPATAGAAAMAPAAAATNNSTAADVATVDVATYIQVRINIKGRAKEMALS